MVGKLNVDVKIAVIISKLPDVSGFGNLTRLCVSINKRPGKTKAKSHIPCRIIRGNQ